jgi:subtilisin-like proprotein convertase family protein
VDTSSYIVQFPPSSTCYIVVSREPADVPTATEGYTLSVTAINPPANDLCSGAVNIPVPGTSPFTNTSLDGRGATPDANVSCNTAGAAELRGGVWYRFAPPAGGDDYNLTIAENSTADAVVAVYRGTSCAGLTQVFCSANDTGNSFVALAGNTYYINYGLQSAATTQPQVVYSISVAFAASTSACCNGATCTSVTRTVCGAIGGATYRGLPTTTCSAAVCGAPPVNDACAGAIALTTFPTAVTVPNAIAARDDVDVSCNGATPSDAAPVTRFGVWYSYTTGADAMIFGVGQLSSNNSVLGMFTGTCGNLTPVACSDPEGLSYTVPANTTAYVLIGMTNAVATPSAAGYSLVFDAVPVTGACCDGGSCTAGMTASACSGGNKLWLGASSTCVATPTFVSFPSAPIFIPYCCLSGVSDILLVSGYPGTISNVRVTVTLQGSRAGNLLLKLKGPNNVTLDLVSRAGATTNCNPLVQAVDGATTTLTGTYVFDDGAVQTLGAAAVVNAVTPSGAYRPSTCGAVPTSLAGAFAGIDPNGQWTLTAIDASGQIAAATLVSWGMTFNGSPSPCDNVGACCVGTACSQSISTMCAGTSTAAALCSANPCGATGVCCRGATCNAAVDAVSCTANAPVGASYASTSGVCNGGGSATFPCCYADFNKNGTLQVQDIFDFLNSWFAGSPFAKVGGDGSGGVLAVQDIFDFLNAWFAGC